MCILIIWYIFRAIFTAIACHCSPRTSACRNYAKIPRFDHIKRMFTHKKDVYKSHKKDVYKSNNALKPGLLGEFAVAGQSEFAAILICLILCCCYWRQHMGHYKSMYSHVQIQVHNNCNVRNVAMTCHDLAFLITCHD